MIVEMVHHLKENQSQSKIAIHSNHIFASAVREARAPSLPSPASAGEGEREAAGPRMSQTIPTLPIESHATVISGLSML